MQFPFDKKKAEIILAVVIILALIFLVVFLLTRGEKETPREEEERRLEDKRASMPPTTVDSRNKEADPNIIARIFVERFGSFSSEVDYQNVGDVEEIVTDRLELRLNQLVAEAVGSGGDAYYGVSTHVIALNELARTESSASYRVTTQRKESINSPANTSMRYQDITVDLVKIGEQWFVDNYQWDE